MGPPWRRLRTRRPGCGQDTPLKIAIIGTRGIPANYGGFETFAEECSARLAERGHSVTVYCRAHHVPKSLKRHRGASLVVLPTLRWKYTDTVVHSALSVLHSLPRHYDVILICNAANSPFAWMPRILGSGCDQRGRHRKAAAEVEPAWQGILLGLRNSLRPLRQRGRDRRRDDPGLLPAAAQARNGIHTLWSGDGKTRRPRGARQASDQTRAVLSLRQPVRTGKQRSPRGRRVRENAQRQAAGNVRGCALCTRIHRTAQEHGRSSNPVPGAIYGAGYRELLANAYCYIHATEVGGRTRP